MFLFSHIKTECCGCSACKNVCPQKIIVMRNDIEGFEYPYIINNNKCIHCSLCQKVCPFSNHDNIAVVPKCYAGWLKDNEARRQSTSGGAFLAIADAAHNNGFTFFYGAAYDQYGHVRHLEVPFEQISRIRGTKYVQSSINNSFLQIKQRLNDGYKVLFVGTPCQVAGLQNYINKTNRDKLITVSLICHGVPSPAAFAQYCCEKKDIRHGEVQQILFRDKLSDRPKNIPSYTSIIYKDGYKKSEIKNAYTIAFGLGLMHRPSCTVCPFTTVYRDCDLSIGDFWGIDTFQPEMGNEVWAGISLLLAHTKSGEAIISKLQSFFIEPKPIEWANNPKQPQLSHPHIPSTRRNIFLERILGREDAFIKTANKEYLRWRIEKKTRNILKVLTKGKKICLFP